MIQSADMDIRSGIHEECTFNRGSLIPCKGVGCGASGTDGNVTIGTTSVSILDKAVDTVCLSNGRALLICSAIACSGGHLWLVYTTI